MIITILDSNRDYAEIPRNLNAGLYGEYEIDTIISTFIYFIREGNTISKYTTSRCACIAITEENRLEYAEYLI